MGYYLSEGVQLRKESWGLLFYSQNRHRLYFVKSREWLSPHYFNGTWTFSLLVDDVTRRTGYSTALIESSLHQSIDNLVRNGLVTHELS